MKEKTEELHPLTTSAHFVVIATMLYFHNVGKLKQVEKLFPGGHPDYLDEKMSNMSQNFLIFWGSLDSQHQRRYVSDALNKYEDESLERANVAMIDTFVEG